MCLIIIKVEKWILRYSFCDWILFSLKVGLSVSPSVHMSIKLLLPEWHKTDNREEFRPWAGVTLA